MRLDHLLSREYKEKDRRDHGAGSGSLKRNCGEAREKALYSFERARKRMLRAKEEGRHTEGV